jgi:uncharacterized protein (TIRG00374 family)
MSFKNLLLFLISLFVGIALFVWIYNIIGWEEIEKTFSLFNLRQGFVIFLLTLTITLIGTWKWQEVLKKENERISFFDLFESYLVGFSIVFLAPIIFFGGEILKSYFLKERKLVSWSKGITSLIIDRVLEWTINLIIILLGVLFFLYTIGFPPKNLAIILGVLFLIVFTIIASFYFKVVRRESVAETITGLFGHRFKEKPLEIEKMIFNFFKTENKTMWKVASLSFLRTIIMYIRAWFLISFLGKEVSIFSVLSILGFNLLAITIPIPAALGSHEAVQVFAFNSLGLEAPVATAFTNIIRVTELVLALIGLVILVRSGIIIFKNNKK